MNDDQLTMLMELAEEFKLGHVDRADRFGNAKANEFIAEVLNERSRLRRQAKMAKEMES